MKDFIKEILEEAVFDENKLVTYKWLSRNMELPVQEAKEKLAEFYDNRKGEKGLNAIYYISGDITGDDENCTVTKVSLVRDKDLEKAKRRYSTLHGFHVYSVQCAELKDLSPVYEADLSDDTKMINSDLSRLYIRAPPIPTVVANGESDGVEENKAVFPLGRDEIEPRSSKEAEKQKVVDKKEPEKPKIPPKEKSKPEKSGKQKTGNIQSMFSAMGEKAAKRPEAPKKTKQAEAAPPKKQEDSEKNKEMLTKLDGNFSESEKKGKVEKKMGGNAKKEEKAPLKRKSGKNKRNYLDDSDDSDNETSSKKTSQSSKNSMDDIFAPEGSSPDSTPVKSSPVRRSPRKHSQSSLSPPKREKTGSKKNTLKSSQQKIDKNKSKTEEKDKEIHLKSTPSNNEEEEDENDDDVIPPTPQQITRKVTSAETYIDDEGFMVVKKSAKTVTEPSPGPSAKPPSPKRSSPRKSSLSPPKKKGKKDTKEKSPKKQASLSSWLKKS